MKFNTINPGLSVVIALLLGVMGVAPPAMGQDAPPAADPTPMLRVTLGDGATLTAPVVYENPRVLVLDLGYDVVSVPRSAVLRTGPVGDAAADHSQVQQHDLYTLGHLPAHPVRELVRRFGDAVVTVRTPSGLGSGFFISDQGHVITNFHVVEGNSEITVTLFKQTPAGFEKHNLKRVKIIATQPLRDLALLQIDTDEIPDLEFDHVILAREDETQVGDVVFAIGNPLGLERSVTKGIVSSTTRTLGQLRFLQTDTSINPGNSGGPLFNDRGEVVAVVCAGYVSFNGLAFGIPGSELIAFLNHRDAYVYDSTQPESGVKYLPPPYRGEHPADQP